MLVLITESGDRMVVNATRIEDISRPGSARSMIEIFEGEKSKGTVDLDEARVELLPRADTT